jgi:thioredoxin
MLELTDENFEEAIKKADKPLLVDFWATWCSPCLILSPILEKIAQDYKSKIEIAKVNVDSAPTVSQKFEIQNIPTVILFNQTEPVDGFVGVRPESLIKEWLDKILETVGQEQELKNGVETEENKEGRKEDQVKSKKMESKKGKSEPQEDDERKISRTIKWYEEYAQKNGLKLNSDEEMVRGLIKGLLKNEDKHGARYCPCRRIAGDIEEDRPKICPCQWHREEIKKDGRCFCGLFVK